MGDLYEGNIMEKMGQDITVDRNIPRVVENSHFTNIKICFSRNFQSGAVEGGELQIVRTSGATEQLTNSNFGGFGGPIARGTWA